MAIPRKSSSAAIKRNKSSRAVRPVRFSLRRALNEKFNRKFLGYYSNHAGKLFGLAIDPHTGHSRGENKWFLELHQLSRNKSSIVAHGEVSVYRDPDGKGVVEISEVEKSKYSYRGRMGFPHVHSSTRHMEIFRPFLEWAIFLARVRKIHLIQLDCYSPKLADYYKQFGFKTVNHAHRKSDDAEAFVMRLDLP